MEVRMVTEQVENFSDKIRLLSIHLYDSTEEILNASKRDFWDGPAAEEFIQSLKGVCSQLHRMAEDATRLYMDVAQEENEWITNDQQGVLRLKEICVVPPVKNNLTIDIVGDYIADKVEDYMYDKRYRNFKSWWKSQTLEEKKKYLQDLQNRLADRYGLPRMLIVVDDLPDKNTDSIGLNIGGVFIIDEDNMNTDDPWRLIETTFHESRHEYQREVIANYQESGRIPDGMTQEQVEKWVNESENYISGTDNFADYYHQAIETDARKFGDIIMKDVLGEMGNLPGGSSW